MKYMALVELCMFKSESILTQVFLIEIEDLSKLEVAVLGEVELWRRLNRPFVESNSLTFKLRELKLYGDEF